MLDHELCELACNFFAVVFACLWTELLVLVSCTTAGRDACGMRTLMDLFFRTSELCNKLLCFSPSGKELYLMRAGRVSYYIQDYVINMRMYAANAIY